MPGGAETIPFKPSSTITACVTTFMVYMTSSVISPSLVSFITAIMTRSISATSSVIFRANQLVDVHPNVLFSLGMLYMFMLNVILEELQSCRSYVQFEFFTLAWVDLNPEVNVNRLLLSPNCFWNPSYIKNRLFIDLFCYV